jgi:replicative DNA helicase
MATGASRQDPELVSLRVPPHSVEAEQAVLGGLMLDNTAWDRIADVLAADDFYRDDHRRIYRHIGRLIDQGRPADVVTVCESVDNSEDKEKTGGLAYLGMLAQSTPSAHNIRRYAEIVRERAVMRRLIMVANEIADSAFSPQGRETSQLLDEAESRIFEIAEAGARGRQGFVEIQPLLAQVMERIDTLYHRENASDITGVPTGFRDLDQMTSGLQEGDLIIVAGRPSMGKAQPLDAKVLTATGWKKMGELRFGDQLASTDGQPSRVSGIFPQGTRQAYRITFSDGRSTECCDEHLWRVNYRDWDEPRVVTTAQLRSKLEAVRYQGRLWIDPVDGNFGHGDPLPLDPYVLGLLLGDGCLAGSSVRFSTADEEILELLAERLGETHSIAAAGNYDYRIVTRGGRWRKGISGVVANAIKEALRALGLWGLQSPYKFVPETYLTAGRETRSEVLRGLLDTDGWVETFGAVRFCTSSERLANDVVSLARSLGSSARWHGKRPKYFYQGVIKEGLPSFVCNISHSNPASLFRLERKRARVANGRERVKRLTIDSIEPTRVTAMQCISVTHPSRLYVTDDYIVTHNTALALNMAEHVAVENRLPVAVFSMEMSGTQLAMRMLGSVGRLDQHKLRTARLSDDDWGRLTHAVSRLHDAPVHIDETAALNSLELKARARRLHRQYGKLGMIVIDYLQLMSAVREGENRATEISEVSRSLKALAKELKVPVVALSQLNRSLEQRPNKRPVMSDLRECVVGQTLACLADGQRVPIRDLVGEEPAVWALSPDGAIVPAKSDKVWSVGIRPVFKLSLESGRSVQATALHRLYGPQGWARVKTLKTGDRLRAVGSSSLYWDTVVAIEPQGEQEVFDLTVPGPASWLADGIVSHNSGAIEQDADLILFIYRDEVYNPESAEKGKAEIIIGKQRNGPIGSVTLTFLGQYTRFENFASGNY